MRHSATRVSNGAARPLSSRGLVIAATIGGVAGIPLSAQDEHAGHTMSMEPAEATIGTDHIDLVHDAERKELTVVLGPIDLPARSSHHMEQMPVQQGVVPFDLTIRGFRTHIRDKDGNDVPRIVLHHMNLLDPNRRELFLPIMLRVLAASHETQPVSLPGWLFGIPMRGGASFLALTMLHNPTDRTYEGVTVHLTMEYERSEHLPLYTITPFHLDAMYPTVSTKAWDLPPGKSSRSWDASPAIRGLIVGMGGHLHTHGTRLSLEDLTTGELLYSVEPVVGEDGTVLEIPTLTHRGPGVGALVIPGHTYRVTAEYYNPLDVPIPDGGMGSVAGGFLPLEPWPAANPGASLFAADYDWVIRSQFEHSAAHGDSTAEGAAAARSEAKGDR